METIMMGYPKHVRVPVRLVPAVLRDSAMCDLGWGVLDLAQGTQAFLRMQNLSSTCLGTQKGSAWWP